MIRSKFRLTAMPVIAAVMATTVCAAFAQGTERPLGFLNEMFGNSDRFSSPGHPQAPSQPSAPVQPPSATQPERVAQVPGGELTMRLDRLEAQIRQLTGAIEQLQYRNQQLEAQLRRLQGTEGPARPAVTPSPVAPPAAAPPPARRGDVFDPAQNPNAPGAPRVLGTIPSGGAAQPDQQFEPDDAVGAPGGRAAGAPLDLSTMAGAATNPPSPRGAPSSEPLPPPPPRTLSSTGAQVATLPPSDSPKDTFDLGYGYILRKDYALAEEAFRNFLRRFPGDRLVPDAHYWFGESLFQRQRYRDAAEAFLNVSTKYETNARAPDALLRLGQSLAAMGEREAACASLAEVLRKYPRASVAVRQGVDREQKRARC